MDTTRATKRKRVPSSKYAGEDWATRDSEDADSQLAAADAQLDDDDSGADIAVYQPKKPKRRAQRTSAAAGAPPEAPTAAAGQARAQRPRLSPKQRRQQQLTAALAARGLPLRDDSRLCAEFIATGSVFPGRSVQEQLESIVNTMDQMRFYFAHTRYEDYREKEISGELRYRGRFDVDEVSDTAKGYALEEWASRFGSLQEAADRPELPASLRGRVLRLRWPIQPLDPDSGSEPDSEPQPNWYNWDFDRERRGYY